MADTQPKHKNFIDLTGQKFGRIRVGQFIGRVKFPSGVSATKWRGQCECGNPWEGLGRDLRKGTTQSCGCLHREITSARVVHGFTRNGIHTPEYRAWRSMFSRCSNPKVYNYNNYGGRGIKVCGRWRESFENFLTDMGLRPSPKHSIDRINNDKDYSKGNCKWSTKAEQSRNRRSTVLLTFENKTLCLNEWAAATGLHRSTLRRRIRKGWSVQQVLTEPLFTHKPKTTITL